MARFVKGDLVAVPFPLGEKTSRRSRPALIVAAWPSETGTDYLAAVIAAQPSGDPHFMEIASGDLLTGSLGQTSYVRPTYLFAIDEHSITRRLGTLQPEKLDAVLSTLAALFR